MRRFWLGLWAYWAMWSTLFSVLSALIIAFAITLGLYLLKGAPALDGTVWSALFEIARFWFALLWSFTLLLALFLVVRRLFYRCIDHRRLMLHACDGSEVMMKAGTGDVIKVWRKWLMAMIWATAAEIIIVIAMRHLAGFGDLLSWFSVYWLYLFVLIAGLITLPLMQARCRLVKVGRC